MKKLSASNKKAQQEAAKAQQEITALKTIIAQGGGPADVQLSGPTPVTSDKSLVKTEPETKAKTQAPKTEPKTEPTAASPTHEVGHQ